MKTLSDVCEVYSGYALKEFNEYGDGLPVIKIGNIMADGSLVLDDCQYTSEIVNAKYLSQKGDIYVALSGATTGKIGILETDDTHVINQRVGIVRRTDDNVPYEYIKYFLLRQTERILKEAAGCAQPNISPKQIAAYEIPDISKVKMLEESTILDSISSLITQRKVQLQRLDELIKARFVELFGDDIAYTGLTIGDISEEATVGIANSATHAYAESGVVMLRNQNIRVNYLDDSDLIYIKPEFASKYENKKLRANDILVTRTGVNVGMACLVPEKYAGCQTFTTLILRLKNNIGITPTFVCHYINSPLGKGFIDEKKVGGAQPNFGVKQLVTMPIAIPSEDKQRIFDVLVNQVDKSKVAIQKSLDETQLLFDSLMQKYFG